MTALSIRWRLSIFFSSAVAVIVLVFGVVLILVTRQQLLDRTDAALREELREIQLEAHLHQSPEEFQLACQTRFFHHDIYEFLVVDGSHQVIFASAGIQPAEHPAIIRIAAAAPLSLATINTPEGDAIRGISEPVEISFGTLQLFALTSLRPMLSDIRTLETLALVLLPGAFLSAIAVGFVLAGRALAPVTAICDVASSVNINHLDRRIHVANPHDELGVLAETVNSLISRLQQAVSEIQRFTADASHEIRTPLAALKLEAELALRSERSPAEYQAALQVIDAEAGRLCRLADQLLLLSREDAGVVDPVLRTVAINQLLQNVLQQLQPLARSRHVHLQSISENLCETAVDELRLRQVFVNLVENALKFTQPEGSVTVSCKRDAHQIRCEIHDTGCGIAAEHLPNIFQRFYRVDAARSCTAEGAGLGLAIASKIIETHRGSISVHSQLNSGTTFTVLLPIRSAEPRPSTPANERRHATQAPSSHTHA